MSQACRVPTGGGAGPGGREVQSRPWVLLAHRRLLPVLRQRWGPLMWRDKGSAQAEAERRCRGSWPPRKCQRRRCGGAMEAGQPTVPREAACHHHAAKGYQLTVWSMTKRCLALTATGALSSWPSRQGAPKPASELQTTLRVHH